MAEWLTEICLRHLFFCSYVVVILFIHHYYFIAFTSFLVYSFIIICYMYLPLRIVAEQYD